MQTFKWFQIDKYLWQKVEGLMFSEVCFCHGWAWGINCLMLHQPGLLYSFLSLFVENSNFCFGLVFSAVHLSCFFVCPNTASLYCSSVDVSSQLIFTSVIAHLFQEGIERRLHPSAGLPLLLSQATSPPQRTPPTPRLWPPPTLRPWPLPTLRPWSPPVRVRFTCHA